MIIDLVRAHWLLPPITGEGPDLDFSIYVLIAIDIAPGTYLVPSVVGISVYFVADDSHQTMC